MTPTNWITLAGILAAFCTLILQIRAKRQDEKLAAQLMRLNRQLSELYGPLYVMFEAGQRNWFAFVLRHSKDNRPLSKRSFFPERNLEFAPPTELDLTEYRRRMEQLFMPTNTVMETAITQHADLIVGMRMPNEFADFLAHVAAGKLVMHRWTLEDEYGRADWKKHRIEYPHPSALKHLIKASFEVLKEVQRDVLTGKMKTVDEEDIDRRIRDRVNTLSAEWEHANLPFEGNLLPQ